MATKNDNVILKLKEQIAKEKESLAKIGKFTPVTNCSIELDGTRYNLHVINQAQTINLLVRVNALRISAKELDLVNEFKISDYTTAQWIEDLKGRLQVVGAKEREQKLKLMEQKLHQLLSEDKKTELEIDSIMKEFNGDL